MEDVLLGFDPAGDLNEVPYLLSRHEALPAFVSDAVADGDTPTTTDDVSSPGQVLPDLSAPASSASATASDEDEEELVTTTDSPGSLSEGGWVAVPSPHAVRAAPPPQLAHPADSPPAEKKRKLAPEPVSLTLPPPLPLLLPAGGRVPIAPRPREDAPGIKPDLDASGDRRQSRLIKNREAATQSRQRRKELLTHLQHQNHALVTENQRLRERVHVLETALRAATTPAAPLPLPLPATATPALRAFKPHIKLASAGVALAAVCCFLLVLSPSLSYRAVPPGDPWAGTGAGRALRSVHVAPSTTTDVVVAAPVHVPAEPGNATDPATTTPTYDPAWPALPQATVPVVVTALATLDSHTPAAMSDLHGWVDLRLAESNALLSHTRLHDVAVSPYVVRAPLRRVHFLGHADQAGMWTPGAECHRA
jgi:hypothetical protein